MTDKEIIVKVLKGYESADGETVEKFLAENPDIYESYCKVAELARQDEKQPKPTEA